MAGEVVIKTRLGTEGLKDAIKDVVNQLKDWTVFMQLKT